MNNTRAVDVRIQAVLAPLIDGSSAANEINGKSDKKNIDKNVLSIGFILR